MVSKFSSKLNGCNILFFFILTFLLSCSWQEKELALAADKFAECQKTIASLGQQLKSLASFEDFLLESESEEQLEITTGESLHTKNGIETPDFRSNDLNLPKKDSEFSHPVKNRKEKKSLLLLDSEKSQNGFGKFFPQK